MLDFTDIQNNLQTIGVVVGLVSVASAATVKTLVDLLKRFWRYDPRVLALLLAVPVSLVWLRLAGIPWGGELVALVIICAPTAAVGAWGQTEAHDKNHDQTPSNGDSQ